MPERSDQSYLKGAVSIRIAGQVVMLRAHGRNRLRLPEAVAAFASSRSDGGSARRIEVTNRRSGPAQVDGGVLNAHGWSLRCDEKELVMADTARYARIDRQGRGTLQVASGAARIFREYPLQHPFDKLIFSYLLSHKGAAVLHACGVSCRDRGLVFAGASGTGKTTLARLWRAHAPQAQVLNDDRVALRRHGRGYRLYGTPWHGDAAVYAAASCPVYGLYFPVHGKSNRLKPLAAARAVQLLAAGSLSWCCHEYLVRKTLDIFAALCASVPCFEFSFVPDRSAIEYLVSRMGSGHD